MAGCDADPRDHPRGRGERDPSIPVIITLGGPSPKGREQVTMSCDMGSSGGVREEPFVLSRAAEIGHRGSDPREFAEN